MRVAEVARSLLGIGGPPVEQRTDGPEHTNEVYRLRRSTSLSYDGAMAHGAVYACVDLLVRLVAWQMPVEVTRNGQPVAPPTIIANPDPQPQMFAQHWRAQAIESAAMRGYVAGVPTSVERDGRVRQMMLLHPDEVSWARKDGRTTWRVNGKPAELVQLGGDLWIAPGPRVAPGAPVGMSVLRYAREQVALGLAATKFGRDFFSAGGLPVSHMKVDEPTVPEPVAELLKARMLAATADRSPLVTGNKVSLDAIRITAEESQFLETVKANVQMVCMFHGIPPESIGGSSGDSLTYANVEGRSLQLLTNTVGAWMQWLEAVLTSLTTRPTVATLDPEAMLRTGVPTLYSTATQAAGRGGPAILTVNEARAMVGYGPHPDGDGLYVPSSVSPAGGDPFSTGGGAQP